MIKKQRKWIALFVALTFMWLLQVSAMPLGAANATEKVSSTSPEQGPNFVEQERAASSPADKKSILPYVLIGVGVVAVAAVLIFVVFKTSYDIVGTWNFVYTWYEDTESYTVIFTGSKTSGNFVYLDLEYPEIAGSYTVHGKNVTMVFSYDPESPMSGKFTGKDTMTCANPPDPDWTWTATRIVTTASWKPTPAAQAKFFHR